MISPYTPNFISENLKSRVTVPIIPDPEKLNFHFKKSYELKWLSNFGPCYQELKASLCNFLGTPFIELFSSGTQALTCGLKTLELKGEVITSPFTFPATINAIKWAGLQPVFADIELETLTISPDSVASMIDNHSSAILGVDVYGNRCEHSRLAKISKDANLKLVYDSAHSFGPGLFSGENSNMGTFNMISFHATKLFHTCEGGALVFEDECLVDKLSRVQNFGFTKEDHFESSGTNAKLSELHAAMGLAVLERLDEEFSHRAQLSETYREILRSDNSVSVHPLQNFMPAYTYFSLLFSCENGNTRRNRVHESLKKNGFGSRKYFNPLCSEVDCFANAKRANLDVAKWVVDRVLCLPLHKFIHPEDAATIAQIVLES